MKLQHITCSNRTYVELKYGKLRTAYGAYHRSNRTYVELK